jgi:hypothetical protein
MVEVDSPDDVEAEALQRACNVCGVIDGRSKGCRAGVVRIAHDERDAFIGECSTVPDQTGCEDQDNGNSVHRSARRWKQTMTNPQFTNFTFGMKDL